MCHFRETSNLIIATRSTKYRGIIDLSMWGGGGGGGVRKKESERRKEI